MKPQMLEKEISIIKSILMSKGANLDILEWGSGGSTIYFTKFMHNNGIFYNWTSVEYNKDWYEKIFNMTKYDKNVDLVLFDVGNTELKQPNTEMEEYVNYPATLEKKYDFILVDGRKRRRCLLEASKLLKPNGVVVLHDARRSHYHSAFSVYPDSEMVLWSGLWVGKLELPSFVRRITNLVKYWFFRFYIFLLRFKPRF